MKRAVLTLALLFGALCASAQQNIVVTKPAGEQELPGIYHPAAAPATSVLAVPSDETPVYQYRNIGRKNADKAATMTKKRMLAPGESVILAVENNEVSDDSTQIQLSSTIETAIARVPAWMQYDLRFKFRRMASTYQTRMVQLITNTPKQYLDEVAYQLTYLPAEVLTHSAFNQASDWNALVNNAKMIYDQAPLLKYVRIKEYGDTNSGDWYTTTEYKIKQGSNYIWREVDRYYYYMFIVMPKLYDEALMVRDLTSYTSQRTWGYFWRDFLWNNPSSAHNYQNVNMRGYPMLPSGVRDSVYIDTIHRLGQLMQMPEYLWDERPTAWNFNRNYSSTQSALDVLGNWCSRCIPWDVTSTSQVRASQPNQIATNHFGNCHEDAILVTSAARTSLIPCMHISDNCDDHVWAAIHDGGDSVWHHFEFFRGGLSSGRGSFWGMTNLQFDGNYGWASSYVHGEVPDGTLINVSKTYSDDTVGCRLKITIKDQQGLPVDGARIELYSTNYQYSSTDPSILSAGYVWTNAQGQVNMVVGTGNKYYMKVYHPKYGSFPTTSGQVLIVYANFNTIAGRTYSFTYTIPTTASTQRNYVTSSQTQYQADKSLSIVAKANNVTTDVRPSDCQGGRFFDRTNTLANLNVYVVDENNINKFKTGDMTGNAEYFFGAFSEGVADIPLHSTGKTYVVLTNNNNYSNYIELNYGYELKNGASFEDNLGLQNAEMPEMLVYPNPAEDRVTVRIDGANGTKAEILDLSGRKVAEQNLENGITTFDINKLQSGVYIVKCGGNVHKIVKK